MADYTNVKDFLAGRFGETRTAANIPVGAEVLTGKLMPSAYINKAAAPIFPSAAEIAAQTLKLQQQNQANDSRVAIRGLMQGFGFDEGSINSLLGQVNQWLPVYDINTITTALLPQTDVYKQRFSANDARIKKGLSALTPQEYFAMESSYRQIMDTYKMPIGFYDDPKTDFANWIANDVSATEIGSRVKTAFDWANNADPEIKKALKDFYGVDDSNLAAYALDRSRAVPLIEKQYKATQIGAEALRQGINVGKTFSEQVTDMGISAPEARQAFGATAAAIPEASKLAAMDQGQIGTTELASAALGIDQASTQKVKTLASKERARFMGEGSQTKALGTSTSGQF